jgi:hypothetical protein
VACARTRVTPSSSSSGAGRTARRRGRRPCTGGTTPPSSPTSLGHRGGRASAVALSQRLQRAELTIPAHGGPEHGSDRSIGARQVAEHQKRPPDRSAGRCPRCGSRSGTTSRRHSRRPCQERVPRVHGEQRCARPVSVRCHQCRCRPLDLTGVGTLSAGGRSSIPTGTLRVSVRTVPRAGIIRAR